jgi:hypothetical protein
LSQAEKAPAHPEVPTWTFSKSVIKIISFYRLINLSENRLNGVNPVFYFIMPGAGMADAGWVPPSFAVSGWRGKYYPEMLHIPF